MTTPLPVPELERPAFFDGQRLDAADLAAVYDFHRQLRWLHNRALHGWGVASGLLVGGGRGAREVTVSPGYALDCAGHDLVLARPATLAVPPVAAAPTGGPLELYLTASYAADDALDVSESRLGVCDGGGAVRRAEAPRLRFQNPRDPSDPATRFRRGLDVVLASILVEGCRLAAAPSPAERRDARPATQPYLAAGATAAGATDWQFFPAAGVPSGVQTRVDTSAAGFRRTPTYVASVVGARAVGPAGPSFDGMVGVAQASPDGFVLRLTMPRDLAAGGHPLNPGDAFTPALLATLRDTLRWSASWIGIEG